MHRFSIPTVLLVSALAVGAVAAQSLGDVARQEEERRKSVKAPPKVYTNKDLGSGALATVAPAEPAPGTTPAPAAPGAAAKPDAPAQAPAVVKDQKYWSSRMKELQTQLERDQTYLDALQSRINALTTDFVNRDDPAQRAIIGRDRDKATAELARLQESLVKTKKAIADLEEEARRANVPPGWLR
jgi:hypothetical protein